MPGSAAGGSFSGPPLGPSWVCRKAVVAHLLLQDGAVTFPDQAYVPNGLLGRLSGMRLFSVQFVLDYVQLRFDGRTPDTPVLNCYAMPAVTAQAGHFVDGQPGYADALRSLIPGVVARTQEATGLGLRIELDTGSAVLHPPAGDLAGPEIALLLGFEDRQWMCWRPGEESFEDLA
jgi:hypothetical protein